MPDITIGINGYIRYNKTDNICYNGSIGSINISNIIFDNLYSSFVNYVINWSASTTTLNSDQIRSDGKSLINLVADTYTFTIESLNSNASLGPYSIVVEDGPQFNLTKIKTSEYSCDENGTIFIEVSGGTPPYVFSAGNSSSTQTDTKYLATGLSPGQYPIEITDSNGCAPSNQTDTPLDIILKRSSFEVIDATITQPLIIDSYGAFDISISGIGPFGFRFTNDETTINYDSLDTTNLVSHDPTTNIYRYSFKDSLYPSQYFTTITNNYGCSSNYNFTIPNLLPITVAANISPNPPRGSSTPKLLLPIFDTVFIPFRQIKENTDLWKLIQNFITLGKVYMKINDQIIDYQIIRTFLYPYCIDSDRIDIVRLDNNEHHWYFCFHIAGGINIQNNLNLIGSELFFVDKNSNSEYKCLLGLDENNAISHDYPSLLIGSFTLPGIVNEEYYDGSNLQIKISDTLPQNVTEYDYFVKDIKTNIYFGSYISGYSTSIYFLENFNIVASQIDINQSACSISNEDFQYITNIHQLLLQINDFNNYQNLYVFNKDFLGNVGAIALFITGNPSAIQDGEVVDNVFTIEYYYFDDESDKLLSFYQNNEKIQNTLLLEKIPDGYVLVRIRDLNNNTVKFLNFNGTIYNYDNHFSDIQNLLEQYNPKIKSYLQNGDIIVYVPKDSQSSPPISIPTIPTTPVTPPQPPPSQPSIPIIKQSKDTTETAKIEIQTTPTNAKCYLLGPKNYKQSFIGRTIFENLVPGVYNIIGDEDYLLQNFLHQSNTRIIVLKNQQYNISIRFSSYFNEIFIKE